MTKIKKTLYIAITFGWLFYLSRYLRLVFEDNESILFWLGFLPNFGLAFALPFVYLGNRINTKKPVQHFNLACFITFLLMVLNEIIDKFQPKRVFDWLDVAASIVGVFCAFILHHFYFKNKKYPS